MAELTLIEALRLLGFTLLPCLGALLASRLWLPLQGPGAWPLHIGLSCLGGPLLTAAALGLMRMTGWALSPAPALLALGLVVVMVTVPGLVSGRLAGPLGAARPDRAADLVFSPRLDRWLWSILLALVALRLLTLLPDLLLRPVFPWDAWKTWAWKARAWFEAGELIAFAPAREWLQAPADAFVIDGVDHPDTVSLMLLWSAIALGRWDDSLLGLPWLLCGIGMALILYGLLILRHAPALIAMLAVYVLLSLPILATHIVLYGYADLWMAGLFTAFAAGLSLWMRQPDFRFLVLMIASASAMVLVKDTGSYWVPVLIAAALARFVPARWLVLGLAAVLLAGLLMLVSPIDPIALLTANRFILDPRPMGETAAGMARHLFVWLDWHLLAWLLPLILAWGWRQAAHEADIRGLLTLICLGLLALLLAFTLTRAAEYAVIGTLFSRMLLQIVPAIIMLAGLSMTVWLQGRRRELPA